MSEKIYGESQADKQAQDLLVCREIVRRIIDMNLSQQQLTFIMRLIALNLDNIEMSRDITESIREAELHYTSNSLVFIDTIENK
jgi:hypothetical protein